MHYHNKHTDMYIREHLESVISKDDLLELSDIDVDGSKLYWKDELVKKDLTDEETETLLVILGKKNKFGCPYANNLKCKQYLSFIRLTEEQVDTVLKEKDFEKRYAFVQEIVKAKDQELYEAQKRENPLITQRSLYHSTKKPLQISFAKDEHITCQVARERCEILQTFYDEREKVNTIEKIRSLLRLEHPEWGHKATTALENALKEEDGSKKKEEMIRKFFSY